jgi:hypothetical protein
MAHDRGVFDFGGSGEVAPLCATAFLNTVHFGERKINTDKHREQNYLCARHH